MVNFGLYLCIARLKKKKSQNFRDFSDPVYLNMFFFFKVRKLLVVEVMG